MVVPVFWHDSHSWIPPFGWMHHHGKERGGKERETHRGSELLGPLLLSRLELVGGRVGSVSQPGVGHLVSDCKGRQGSGSEEVR